MVKLTSDMNFNKERQGSGIHASFGGTGFHAQGARTYKEAKAVHIQAEPYGSNPFNFTRISGIPTPAQDWRMVEDPNNPGIYRERVMLSGTGPNAKKLHGN